MGGEHGKTACRDSKDWTEKRTLVWALNNVGPSAVLELRLGEDFSGREKRPDVTGDS